MSIIGHTNDKGTTLIRASNLRLGDLIRRGSQLCRVTGIGELTTGYGAKLLRVSIACDHHSNFKDADAVTCSPGSYWHLVEAA
jgi:hypothetical protein